MPSPYVYTPRRRLLAQLVLAALLAATLGAAHLLARHRDQQGVLELAHRGWRGNIEIAYPQDWLVDVDLNSVIAVDPKRIVDGVPGRLLRIQVRRKELNTVEEALADYARGLPLTDERSLTVARRRGRAAIVRDSENGAESAVAVAIARESHMVILVEVTVRGAKLSPQDIGLLNDICEEVLIADNALE